MSTVGTDGLGHEQLDLKNTFRIRQVYQPNTNVNTNIQFHKWSNINVNEKNRVFEYRHKCNYVFDPNPDVCFCWPFGGHLWFPSQSTSDAELWCFSLIVLTSCWTNSRVTGYLRKYYLKGVNEGSIFSVYTCSEPKISPSLYVMTDLKRPCLCKPYCCVQM